MTTNAPDSTILSDAGGKIASTLRDYPGMNKIIVEYVAGLHDDVRKINDLLNRGEMQGLRRVVHQLHGTGGGYGFDVLSDLAGDVEDAINACNQRTSIALKINRLVDAIGRIEGFAESVVVLPANGGKL